MSWGQVPVGTFGFSIMLAEVCAVTGRNVAAVVRQFTTDNTILLPYIIVHIMYNTYWEKIPACTFNPMLITFPL